MNEQKERIDKAIGGLGDRYDRERIAAFLSEFLNEAAGHPPMSFVPDEEGCAAAFVIMEDVARAEPKLVTTRIVGPGDIGVPKEIAEIFTWALAMGIYLASKGAATWPTKNLNS